VSRERQTTVERAVLLLRALIPEWLPIPTSGFQRLVRTIWIALALGVLLLIIPVVDKPLWAWLKLLIVPAVLAIGVAWLTWTQHQRQSEAEEARKEREQKIENQRAQDAALQAYLDQMGQLMLEKNLRNSALDSEARTLARARTLTILVRLDRDHKRNVLQFLYESNLIAKEGNVVDLKGADLGQANLDGINLEGADLEGTGLYQANLSGAKLRGASLREANLKKAVLSLGFDRVGGKISLGADLYQADLSEANLSQANLSGYNYLAQANLSGADLSKANLAGVNLSGAKLSGANLIEANLSDVTGLTEEQITAAWSFERATMPNGQKYEDWLKSRGQENSGP
jgi:uncharacterized protein YjbI with pentapeptide repeats